MPNLRENEWTTCPACGEKTVVKLKTEHLDWSRTRKFFACAMCGAELGTPDDTSAAAAPDSSRRDALAALLGGGGIERPTLAPGEAHGHFCRNCRHFVAHPFKSMCSLRRRETDPGSDCDRFAAAEE